MINQTFNIPVSSLGLFIKKSHAQCLISWLLSGFFILLPLIDIQAQIGQYLIWTEGQVSMQSLFPQSLGVQNEASQLKKLSPYVNIYSINFGEMEETAIEAILSNSPKVLLFQKTHKIQRRSNDPNDPMLSDQWSIWSDYQGTGGVTGNVMAYRIWDENTGGVTAGGDTIVTAILDSGFEIDHEDLNDNIWTNRKEIPENGVDDDENGYIDDYQGWNFYKDTSSHEIASHGTAVAGIIGARADNGIGISGINWYAKMLPLDIIVSASEPTDEKILEAYAYVLNLRREYNQSQGQSGALIVATNTSWGIDNGQPSEAPLWCAMYDSLGQAGILNAAASPNKNWDIDQRGDLPTGCSSDFLISVTSTDIDDHKYGSAAFGLNTIDLGAPGRMVVSTTLSDSYYSSFTGTSFATPHVTGGIGLLYGIKKDTFIDLVLAKPSTAAMLVKDVIINGVDIVPDLNDKTVSGGRLNLWNSYRLLKAFDNQPEEPEEPDFLYPEDYNTMDFNHDVNSNQLKIRVVSSLDREAQWKIYSINGQLIYTGLISIEARKLKEKYIATGFLTGGLYIVSMQLQEGEKPGRYKFIKL